MEPELLRHAIWILGATHDPKALPAIEPSSTTPDQVAREKARLAAAEITASNPEDTIHKS
ncbi:hypothetical protein OG331_51690 [Streptomyces sp. NBC_01017]|uniref:hypothetical protein n=1 Tax=Streptomyces sp. NBC_01017 TaxID=2903721 RepID=UPI0038682916|nr:hypothetical protein OG331_00280 [Streptomyces sp. NBC_01017]WSV35358.1 hypothetical protein OG331_51690 [Streptomyces sp. NBC_01017]